MDTSPASSAPAISSCWRTRSSSTNASVSVEEIPTRIAPRSRRCRVRARVSMPEMPTTPCALQLVVEAAPRPPVAGHPGRVADDVAGHPDPRRLGILVVDAGVADVRCGHHHDLAVVRRVGERLLVAGHAGVEDRLAEGLALGAVALAAEGAAVLEDEDRWEQACSGRSPSPPHGTVVKGCGTRPTLPATRPATGPVHAGPSTFAGPAQKVMPRASKRARTRFAADVPSRSRAVW